jgi:hypothetical protein
MPERSVAALEGGDRTRRSAAIGAGVKKLPLVAGPSPLVTPAGSPLVIATVPWSGLCI